MPIIRDRDMPLRREAYQAAMGKLSDGEKEVLKSAILKIQDAIGGGKSLTVLEITAAVGMWLLEYTKQELIANSLDN